MLRRFAPQHDKPEGDFCRAVLVCTPKLLAFSQLDQVSTSEAVVCSSIGPPTAVLSWQAAHIERIGSVVEITYPELQDR